MLNNIHPITLISDTHFGHKRMIDYGRPYDFDDKLIKGLHKIDPSNILIHLGDICMGRDQVIHDGIIQYLQFYKKILVKGNHDNKSDTWYYNNGWDCVCSGMSIRYLGKNILFTHKPKKQSDSFDMNIHGHLHTIERPERIDEFGSVYNPEYHKLVSMEYSNYLPISLDKIIR